MSKELIWVRPSDLRKVGIVETNEEHPGGIARVVGDAMSPDSVQPIQVYPTPRILHALGRNYIEQVSEAEVREVKTKAAPPKRTRKKVAKAAPVVVEKAEEAEVVPTAESESE
jgi:hypothetical protein